MACQRSAPGPATLYERPLAPPRQRVRARCGGTDLFESRLRAAAFSAGSTHLRRGVLVWGAARRGGGGRRAGAEAHGTLHALKWDLAGAEATVQAVKALDAACGGLDLVVANAGVANETAGESRDWAAIGETVDVNVLGALATLVGATPGTVQRGRGQLVGVSSLARGAAEVNFSWPRVFTSRLLRWLPNGLWDWASQALGPRPGSR